MNTAQVADAYTLMASSYKRSSDVDNAQKFYTDARGMYRVLAVMQDTIGSSKGVESAKTKVLKIERELATLHIVMENYDQVVLNPVRHGTNHFAVKRW